MSAVIEQGGHGDDREVESGRHSLSIEDRSDAEQDAFGAWWQSFLRGGCFTQKPCNGELTVVDLFCGAGGLAVGVELAGRAFGHTVKCLAAVDADGGALEVYEANNDVLQTYNESVTALVDYHVRRRNGESYFAYPPEIVHSAFSRAQDCDVVIAGPPCQGHSNLNNHTRRNDPRDDLFVAAAATAIALNCKAAIIENVPTVTRSHGEVVKVARELFEKSGYSVTEDVLKADELGGPQRRARYFMVAVKREYVERSGIKPNLGKLKDEHQRFGRSLEWAIGDLVDCETFSMFDRPGQVGATNQRRIDWLFDNNAFDLPNSQRPDCHKDGTTYTAVYGRMYADRPAQTVTTGFGTPGQGRYIHPTRRRLITPHEAARLQGFPDSYAFIPNGREPLRREVTKWIGDAVPSLLGMYVGICAQETIFARRPVLPWHVELGPRHVGDSG